MAEEAANAEINARLAMIEEYVHGIANQVQELWESVREIAEVAASGGRTEREGPKKRRKGVPSFKFWSSKRRGRISGVYVAHRLLRFKKSPTQWGRFGGQVMLRYLGAPAVMLSGFSMLVTVIHQLWQEWLRELERQQEEIRRREWEERRRELLREMKEELLAYRSGV